MGIPRFYQYILGTVGVMAIGIQFIPVSRTNPPAVKELVWDSAATRDVARKACYDCHSNETRWPWYSHVAPVSWFVVNDVNNARERLNFSEISSDDRVGILVKRITKGEMPPADYRFMHAAARLSKTEKDAYVAGLRRSFELSGLEPHSQTGCPRLVPANNPNH